MGFTAFPDFPGDREALDQLNNQEEQNAYVRVYEWEGIHPVLGKTTHENPDLNMDAVRSDGLTVYRRKGGGGAVVLMPGVLVITAAYKKTAGPPDLPRVIEGIADVVGEAVRRQGLGGVNRFGMGDICLGHRKILGSSLYQTREAILYQGSLLVDADLGLIIRYLNHPSKEPDYRQGREHDDFLTTMALQGSVDRGRLIRDLTTLLDEFNLYGEDL